MEVERIDKKKLVSGKYEISVRVNRADYLNDQRVIAKADIDYIAKKDVDGKYDILIYRVRPASARREIESKLASGEFTKDEVAKTLLAKLKSSYTKELKNYYYAPDKAIDATKRAVRKDKHYDNYEKLAIEAGINQYVEKYGPDKANADFNQILTLDHDYDYDMDCYVNNWRIEYPDEFKLLEKEYVRPEDIGREKFSKVVSSSFSTYYYYKVKVKILNNEFEDIITLSSYYSGGWD